MANNTGRMMSYIDWLPPRKLLNPLITRSYRIMWQTKTIVSPILFYLNFILFVNTRYANLYFNQCSIFTEYCFQLLNRMEWVELSPCQITTTCQISKSPHQNSLFSPTRYRYLESPVWPSDKLKPSYLYYHKFYGHHSC